MVEKREVYYVDGFTALVMSPVVNCSLELLGNVREEQP